MRLTFLFIFSWLIFSCSSTEIQQNEKDDTSSEEAQSTIIISNPPSDFDVGPVYINELAIIESDSELHLKISGQLPESCSELYELEFAIEDTHIAISLSSWRPKEMYCMQALVDFEYEISDINPTILKKIETWTANDNSGEF